MAQRCLTRLLSSPFLLLASRVLLQLVLARAGGVRPARHEDLPVKEVTRAVVWAVGFRATLRMQLVAVGRLGEE